MWCLLPLYSVEAESLQHVESIINRVNNYWQMNHRPQTHAFWDVAVYHTGNMAAYQLLKNPRWLQYSENWAEYNHWEGASEKDASRWVYKKYGEDQQHVLFGDWQVCFQTYLDLYQIAPDPIKIARAKEVMGYEADSGADDYWWWADALYMVMPVMTKMYRLTGEEKYLDKLYENVRYSDSIMLDKKTGLYYRDARYVYPAHRTLSGEKDFWARGDGWVLAGLARVLQDMPENCRYYSFFVKKFVRLAYAVARLQQKEGYWTRSLMDPAQAPGPETSGTALFTYGILWGINHGILEKSAFKPVIKRSWRYLSEKALQKDGSVGYVQPIGDRAIPGQSIDQHSQSDFGVGAFLLASCEYARYIANNKYYDKKKSVFTGGGIFVGGGAGLGR
ncbi:glycosyl hydrolase family 88 [Segatella asaccharophila]|jgi:rhamnogalacturonyl hydrolase YesR